MDRHYPTDWPWPSDLAFRYLASAVSDGVTYAVNSGMRISERRGINCCCPLGAALLLTGKREASHPGAAHFLNVLSRRVALWDSDTVLPDGQMVWAFIAAFEVGSVSTSLITTVEASSRLGIWYRKRFLGLKEAPYCPPGQKLTKPKVAR